VVTGVNFALGVEEEPSPHVPVDRPKPVLGDDRHERVVTVVFRVRE
jgi:hypothetical protein